MTGKRHSEETIKKIKESNLGLKRSAETRERISQSTKKQFSDPKQRELLAEKVRIQWQNPTYRKTQVEKKKGVPTGPCSKSKRIAISESKRTETSGISKVNNRWRARALDKHLGYFSSFAEAKKTRDEYFIRYSSKQE